MEDCIMKKMWILLPVSFILTSCDNIVKPIFQAHNDSSITTIDERDDISRASENDTLDNTYNEPLRYEGTVTYHNEPFRVSSELSENDDELSDMDIQVSKVDGVNYTVDIEVVKMIVEDILSTYFQSDNEHEAIAVGKNHGVDQDFVMDLLNIYRLY